MAYVVPPIDEDPGRPDDAIPLAPLATPFAFRLDKTLNPEYINLTINMLESIYCYAP